MLQIVTKMYFREGVPLHSNVQRDVLYTNRDFLRRDPVELPVGELAPSTMSRPVSPITVSVTEHLEARKLDGSDAMLIATSGDELIDQLADVLSFGLNSIFSRDRDLVQRLVPGSLDNSSRSSASTLFQDTFDPHRFVPDSELDEFRSFMSQLLALKRSHFEAAMRAIRRIVRAMQLAVDDATVAYVDVVAALESLSAGTSAPAPTWDRFDGRKRRLIDDALDGADPDAAERVRQAVMEAERAGAKARFVAFLMSNVSPDYFRAEATGALLPLRGADFERAVKLAYDVRSRNVHVLEELPPEAWVLGERADTVSPRDMGTMLSLQGLARLARHVVRSYVDCAPLGVDPEFNWRASLPGQLQMRAAPQYWVWNADGFDHDSVNRYFSGFVAHVVERFTEPDQGLTDIRPVLERIEHLLPGTAEGPAKTLMVAIYALWHRLLAPDAHRAGAARLLAQHERVLQHVGMPSFVVGLLSNQLPEWTDEQRLALATERRAEREKRHAVELPPGVDAALQVIAAEALMKAGRTGEAQTLAGFAVEELPGNESLMTWENGVANGEIIELDVQALVLGLQPSANQEEPYDGGDVAATPEDPDNDEPDNRVPPRPSS